MPTRPLLVVLLVALAVVGWVVFSSPSRESLVEQHHRGVALIEQHKFTDAEVVLQAVVDAMPEEFVPRFNLGVAQLNQAETGVGRALDTLLAARELGGDAARIAYCLGVIHRFVGDEEKALAEFRRAAELAPGSADANYQVAISLTHLAEHDQALPYFEIVVRLDPTILGAWHNLQLLYRRTGRTEDADRALAQFIALKDSGRGHAHSTKYTEQGDLSLAMRDWDFPLRAFDAPLSIRFAPPLPLTPETRDLSPPPAAALVDLDLDCQPELWVAGPRGAIWSFEGPEPQRHAAPPELLAASTFAVGDIDEDGVPDLVTATGAKITVYGATGVPVPVLAERQSFTVAGAQAILELRLLDLDLEGDLDLLIILADGPPRIALNEGRSLRESGEPALPWPEGASARALEIVFARDIDGDSDADLAFSGPEGPPYLRGIENAPQWRFVFDPEGMFPRTAADGPFMAAAADLDGDTRDDFLLVTPGASEGTGFTLLAPGTERFFGALEPPTEFIGKCRAMALADFDLDGHLDLLLSVESGGALGPLAIRVLRNDGAAHFEQVAVIDTAAVVLITGDIDDDLDPDVIAISQGGVPVLVRNATDPRASSPPNHAVRLYLGGARDSDRHTNLLGYGTRVEIRAGDLSVARTFEGAIGHRAQGIAPLVLGIGARDTADWAYLAWPDGVTQSQLEVPLDRCHIIEEVQRKSSSCPVLFTWDGSEYRFITDFMGGGGLGFWTGPDEFAPPEPTEVVRIEPGALAPLCGELRLSVMEPMQEAAYVDRLTLLAVDHPPGTEVYPHEYFPVAGVAPSGAPLLVRTQDRRFPTVVRDADGAVDRTRLLEVDRQYAGPRALDPDLVGYAAAQRWTLTFDPPEADDARVFLFLDGWVEYPYSRINFAAWQKGSRLEAPTFQWDRGDDDWQLLGAEIGYPAGMPKTMVLDVSDAISAGATRFRIDTNLELYWDRIFLAPATELGAAVSLPRKSAVLRFGGYPKEYSDDDALPATYHYDERDSTLDYRPMGGLLTRYGEVGGLIDTVDDEFALIGGGDELILRYDATVLPELAEGWQRTYLLDTHGYCKDRDPLTATPESVEPLPFGGMSAYPPAEGDREPDREEYRQTWNTRRD